MLNVSRSLVYNRSRSRVSLDGFTFLVSRTDPPRGADPQRPSGERLGGGSRRSPMHVEAGAQLIADRRRTWSLSAGSTHPEEALRVIAELAGANSGSPIVAL